MHRLAHTPCRRVGRGLLAGAALAAVALGTAGAAAGTVTSTRPVKEPPYYRGDAPAGGTAGRLPVVVSPAPGLPDSWVPLPELGRLAAEMDAWLEGRRVVPLPPVSGGSGKAAAPAVYLGCPLDPATEECSAEERANVLAVTSPGKGWRQALGAALDEAGVERALVVRLELAPHWIRQKGLKGHKRVPLGTGHDQELPWLTSLDTPVWVLQVTGAVVDAEGRVLRSGAEGIWALRTPFRASALGAQRLLAPEDVEYVRRDLLRTDLPGAPLAWQVALGHLTDQLLDAQR